MKIIQSEQFPVDIDVKNEVSKRFEDFENRLESDQQKRQNCEMTKQYFEFIIGKSKDFTPEFSKIWLAPLRPVATKKTKKKLTDSSGNITWSIGVEKTNRKESAVGDKTTLMFAASKIKGIFNENFELYES